MAAAREAGNHERVVRTAEALRPDVHADRSREADYLGHLRLRAIPVAGACDDAVLAFRRAEVLSPHHVHRDPFVPEALAGLLARSRRDSRAEQQLRG